MRSAPSSSPWPALDAAVENIVRLTAEWRAAFTAIERAKQDETDAVAVKRAAAVKLRLEGKSKQPSTAAVEAAREKIATAEEEYEVLKGAVSEAIALVTRLRDENRAEWSKDADSRVSEVHANYGQAVVAMLEARREWHEARALAQWVETGNMKLAAGTIADVPWAKVEHELRVESGLDKPAPKTLPEHLEHAAKHGPPLGPDGKPASSMQPGGPVQENALVVLPESA